MLRYINTRQMLNTVGHLLVQKTKAQLRIDGTVATKKLLNSISYSLSFGQNDHKLMIWADRKMGYVDKGRKAGRTPAVSTILKWAEAKGIKPRSSDGRYLPNTKKNRAYMAKNIARAIGEKGTIKRFGYKGSDVIDFVLQNNRETINRELVQFYQKDLHEHIQQNVIKK